MSKGVQIGLAALSVFVGVVIVLTLSASGDGTFRYFSDVNSFTSAPSAETANLSARVHGFVVAGSIEKELDKGHVNFRVADKTGTGTLPVRYLGIDVPDMFKDGAEVVVEGHYASGLFMAEKVMAKCPSKYEAKQPASS
jgi:cytochrome c-type biogenesis protein CcmE